VEKDLAQAAKWFGLAAEQGDADAQGSLGLLYAEEQGVERNLAEAEKWLSKAAAQGNETARENLKIPRRMRGRD